MNPALTETIAASDRERSDLFSATALRMGTTIQNIEKDFWVCWTLDALFNGLTPGGPRLLFKGGTSLSKGYGLISRFSEDVDVTVFRADIGEAATFDELAAMTGKKRGARLDAIKAACQSYIQGPLRVELTEILVRTLREAHRHDTDGFRVVTDDEDPDGQSLLVWYPSVIRRGAEGYIRPAVKIESGAKSALDPHASLTVKPYIADNVLAQIDLSVGGVTTVDSERTFWDKVVILHGLRRWFERRSELRGGNQRVSRHYYDVYKLLQTDLGAKAVGDVKMALDCVRHARMFFNRPDFDLATAVPGTFALAPHDGMIGMLRRDYAAMSTMLFGTVPSFDDIIGGITRLESTLNRVAGG